MTQNTYLRGVLGMIASSALFSCMAFLIRLGEGIDFFTTAFARFGVGLSILGTLALFGRIRLDFHNSPVLFLRGLFGGLAVVLFYMSIAKIGIAKGTVISYLYPLFATIGGAVILKDRIRAMVWVFLGIAAAGMVLLSGAVGTAHPLAGLNVWVALALLGAVLAGLAIVCIKKLTVTDSPYSTFMAQCLVGFWIVVLPANTAAPHVALPGAVLLVGIGASATVAQLLMTASYSYVPIAAGSLLNLLTPMFNVLLGLFLFREVMSGGELAGTALILLSCLGVVALGRERLPAKR